MQQNNFRQLNRTQSILFMTGGALMVVGMGAFVFQFQQLAMAVVFLVGALLFAVMQCMQSYSGNDITLRRLKNIMNLADLLFVLAGILMIDTPTHFMRQMFNSQTHYIQYIYNKWLVLLMIAVILEVYTVHRISYELNKQKRNTSNE